MELADFTAVLDELTKNTYVLVIVHNPTIGMSTPLSAEVSGVLTIAHDTVIPETAALRMNIRLARKKFEEIQGDNLLS